MFLDQFARKMNRRLRLAQLQRYAVYGSCTIVAAVALYDVGEWLRLAWWCYVWVSAPMGGGGGGAF